MHKCDKVALGLTIAGYAVAGGAACVPFRQPAAVGIAMVTTAAAASYAGISRACYGNTET